MATFGCLPQEIDQLETRAITPRQMETIAQPPLYIGRSMQHGPIGPLYERFVVRDRKHAPRYRTDRELWAIDNFSERDIAVKPRHDEMFRDSQVRISDHVVDAQ